MARTTKAQLEQQLAALQAAYEALAEEKQQVADACQHLSECIDVHVAQVEQLCRENEVLRSEVAQASRRIESGHQMLRQLKQEHAAVVAQYEAKPKAIFVRTNHTPRPIVTRFYRGGQLWEKTRVGNVATERLVETEAA